jgi:hypothetical protein
VLFNVILFSLRRCVSSCPSIVLPIVFLGVSLKDAFILCYCYCYCYCYYRTSHVLSMKKNIPCFPPVLNKHCTPNLKYILSSLLPNYKVSFEKGIVIID